MSENKIYTTKVHKHFKKILSKFDIHYEFNLKTYIDECYHLATFYYYDNQTYDWSFTVFARKLGYIKNNINKEKCIIKKDDYELKVPHESSVLKKTLANGTLIQRKHYSNWSDYSKFSNKKMLDICVSTNTVTIFCKNINPILVTLNLLGRLWSGMILDLQDFWWITKEGMIALLMLVVNCDNTQRGWKLLFSKIKFSKLDKEWYYQNFMKYFEIFFKNLELCYTLQFENLIIDDLINKDCEIVLNKECKIKMNYELSLSNQNNEIDKSSNDNNSVENNDNINYKAELKDNSDNHHQI